MWPLGAKGNNYSLKTSVFSSQQNSLVNQGLSTVDQIFKREGFGIDITFVGTSAPNATTQVGDANVIQEAKKAHNGVLDERIPRSFVVDRRHLVPQGR